MGQLAHHNVLLAIQQLSDYSEEREAEIISNEDKLDIYEDRLGDYLVQISQHGVSMEDIRTVSRLLHAIGDFERLGDHSLNLQESARELREKELHFSDGASAELQVLISALMEIMDQAFTCFSEADPEKAREVEPLEETIDRLSEEIRVRHIHRLQTGDCTIQLGFILSDLLTNLERVSDHCSNIAVSVIEEYNVNVDPHAYLNDIKTGGDFTRDLEKDLARFRLPEA